MIIISLVGERAQMPMRRKRMQEEDAEIIIISWKNNNYNYTCSNDNYISGEGGAHRCP